MHTDTPQDAPGAPTQQAKASEASVGLLTTTPTCGNTHTPMHTQQPTTTPGWHLSHSYTTTEPTTTPE